MMEWVEVVASAAGRRVEDEWPPPSSWSPSAVGTCVGDDDSEALVSEWEEDGWVADETEGTTEAAAVLLSAGAAHTSLYNRKKVNANPQDSDCIFRKASTIVRNPGTGKRYGTHWTQITRARMHWSHTLQPGRMCLNPALRPRSYRY